MPFLEAVGVREYCWMAVEISWQLCALRAFSASKGSANPHPSECVAFRLIRKPPNYVRWVALSREPPKLQQPQPLLAAWDRDRALMPSCDTRCWRAKLGMRHADLLREATARIAKPASAPCMILQCGTWYGCVAVWPRGCVFGGGMWAMRSAQKLFWLGFRLKDPVEKVEFFDWIRQTEFSVKKSWVEKALFRLYKKARFRLQPKTTFFDWESRLADPVEKLKLVSTKNTTRLFRLDLSSVESSVE